MDGNNLYRHNIVEGNYRRYKGVMPSRELVQACVDKGAGGSTYRFTRIYALPDKMVIYYLKGKKHRGIAKRWWHFFYEFDHLDEFYKSLQIKQKRERKKKEKEEQAKSNAPVISLTNKSVLDALKTRLSRGEG